MELRHLRYFTAVAGLRSFTLAARQLNISQSGVSGQIRDLEQELRVPLLRRTKRDVALTPEGIVFLAEAKEILERAERAMQLTLHASAGQTGKLTVGLCGPVTAPFLPKLIRQFRKSSPGVSLAVRERAPAEQIKALLDMEIDIAFARSIPAGMKQFVSQELLFREPAIIALAKDHPLARAESIAVRDLVDQPLILYGREGSPDVFDAILTMCRKAHFSPRIADTPSSWHSVLTMVESGEGVGVVPRCVRHLRGNDIVFRPLSGVGCRFDAIVAWRRHDPGILQERFIDLLRQSEFVRGLR